MLADWITSILTEICGSETRSLLHRDAPIDLNDHPLVRAARRAARRQNFIDLDPHRSRRPLDHEAPLLAVAQAPRVQTIQRFRIEMLNVAG